MIVVLNGPLGIGKSTLAEALMESMESCVLLDGDHVVAANPAPSAETGYLHSTIALLVGHHQRHGYRHFVINHVWQSPEELDDLRQRLLQVDPHADVHCFRLTLPRAENLRRIERRQDARALDEREFELQTVAAERDALDSASGDALGEPFDVAASPEELVAALLLRLGQRQAS
jgi:hypothetical protein